jgi:hypothetical protein
VAGAAFMGFAAGAIVGGALYGNTNWGGGEVNVNRQNYNNFTNNVNRTDVAQSRSQRQASRQSSWQHNPDNRRGTQYRDASTQQRFNRGSNPQATQARESFRGRAEQGRQDLGSGGAQQFGQGGGRQAAQSRAAGGGDVSGQRAGGRDVSGQRAGGGQGREGLSGQRGSGAGGFQGGGQAREGLSGQRSGGGGGGAFQGVGQGRDVQQFSSRGQASRQSSGGYAAGRSSGGSASPRSAGGGSRGGGGGGGGRGGGGRR